MVHSRPVHRGSSPRVRGKQDVKRHDVTGPGLIPARAGKTALTSSRSRTTPAHPRACGENLARLASPSPWPGSSPRVRGKHRVGGLLGDDAGLIPARAGKTVLAALQVARCQAHPRACGENAYPVVAVRLWSGSSPRVRGKLDGGVEEGAQGGLIPARAGKTAGRTRSPETCSAHPRACGENGHFLRAHRASPGSSPRVRGKRRGGFVWGWCRGLIPARAGKTPTPPGGRASWTAHPRACGENVGVIEGTLGPVGSSPRVRGKLVAVLPPHHHAGLIPARAGKTRRGRATHPCRTAHPRACGENVRSKAKPRARPGSSPRVRGKRAGGEAVDDRGGLIPARAGKTRTPARLHTMEPAHPRACGENAYEWVKNLFSGGSSPRVRGKLVKDAVFLCGGRLIPACAGKTASRRCGRRRARAHPRVCGENLGCRVLERGTGGSSPRVRGKRRPLRPGDVVARLIPACAGKTATPSCAARTCAAHPRACGENAQAAVVAHYRDGSSPRVRGKREDREAERVRDRLIPARAGKTTRRSMYASLRGAHPRACGENGTPLSAEEAREGSSPRVRGKRRPGCWRGRGGRLIPARAGKTGEPPRRGREPRAHPRACGENLVRR